MDLRRRLRENRYSCQIPPPHLVRTPYVRRSAPWGGPGPYCESGIPSGRFVAQLQGSQGSCEAPFSRIQADVGAGGRGTLLKISRPPGKNLILASSSSTAKASQIIVGACVQAVNPVVDAVRAVVMMTGVVIFILLKPQDISPSIWGSIRSV